MRATLLCHAATAAHRAASFPCDEPLSPRSLARIDGLGRLLPAAAGCLSSPALRARQTAEALRLSSTIDPGLADWDLGRWAGRALDELERADPAAVSAWLGDPDAAPHGGETLNALLRRVAAWLEGRAGGGAVLAVTHAAVVRAAAMHAIAAPAASFWRLDVRPLSLTVLSRGPGGWRLQQLAAPLRPDPGDGSGPPW